MLSSTTEHHANMLPWRRHDVRLLPFTRTPDELLDAAERALRAEQIDLVAVTGASNVTGEVWPVAELAELAHDHGAELFVDAAQLAPHRAIDMARAGIDHLALSGHKLYAPFGSGALVGRLREGPPLLAGGGAIRLVTVDDVTWAPAPDRFEAGSPNVIGVIALAAACRSLMTLGMDAVAAHERSLAVRMWTALARVPGLEMLTQWPPGTVDRVGVATFNLDGYRDPLLAAILSAEHAIGVRHGCFCAHPLMTHLLGVPDGEAQRFHAELRAGRHPALPGAVRASIGLGTTAEDIDRLVGALREIAAYGPRSHTCTCPSTTSTARSEVGSRHERPRLQVRRDHRLVAGGRHPGDRPRRGQGVRVAAPPRLVRADLRPRPDRRRQGRPLPGDAEDRLPARGLVAELLLVAGQAALAACDWARIVEPSAQARSRQPCAGGRLRGPPSQRPRVLRARRLRVPGTP